MSYNILIFDKSKAPKSEHEFVEWFENILIGSIIGIKSDKIK